MSLQITGLFYYPVKACAGVATDEATLEAQGMRWDRRWMVVEAGTGLFLTQREFPQMARIRPTVNANGLCLEDGERPPLVLPIRADAELARREVTVWRFNGSALDEGEEAAEYVSAYLKGAYRLVRTPEDFTRRINPLFGGPEDRVGFADGYAVLLASESSLADLNTRLSAPVSMTRFRPNIVVAGAEPFAEDGWRTLITSGGVRFRVAKPCARCAVITVDQKAGVKTGTEPLATLATFRKDVNNGVNFATNLIHETPGGVLRIGDTLTVESRA